MLRRILSIMGVLLLAACTVQTPSGDGASSSAKTDDTHSEGSEKSEAKEADDNDEDNDEDDMENGDDASETTTDDDDNDDKSGAMAPRVIRLTTTEWEFSPSTITVKKGEKVTIELAGVSGIHGFAIADLGITTKVEPGQTVSVTIPTDAAGTYTFFCNVPCGEGHKEMKGTLVIEA